MEGIEYVSGRRAHVFECGAGKCRGKSGRDVQVMFVGSWTLVMQGPRAAFVGMQKSVGVTKLRQQQMVRKI
jgi:hypothetical protein